MIAKVWHPHQLIANLVMFSMLLIAFTGCSTTRNTREYISQEPNWIRRPCQTSNSNIEALYGIDTSNSYCAVGTAELRHAGSLDVCREKAFLSGIAEIASSISATVSNEFQSFLANVSDAGTAQMVSNVANRSESSSNQIFHNRVNRGPEWISATGECHVLVWVKFDELKEIVMTDLEGAEFHPLAEQVGKRIGELMNSKSQYLPVSSE